MSASFADPPTACGHCVQSRRGGAEAQATPEPGGSDKVLGEGFPAGLMVALRPTSKQADKEKGRFPLTILNYPVYPSTL